MDSIRFKRTFAGSSLKRMESPVSKPFRKWATRLGCYANAIGPLPPPPNLISKLRMISITPITSA